MSKEQKKPLIYVDTRELRSHVATELEALGAVLEFPEMEVADYCLSDRVGVERKAVPDFLKSWIEDKILFGQIYDLSHSYQRPLLIIEGGEDALYEERRVHPASVQGLLDTIVISFRCPVIFTSGSKETALRLFNIAKREQDENPTYFSYHGKRTHLTEQEQLVYTLSSIPDIGRIISKNLLNHFGSLQAVCNAEQEELLNVPLVGDVNSIKIMEFFRREYRSQNGTEEHLRSESKSS